MWISLCLCFLEEVSQMMEYAGNPGEGDGSSACIPNLRTINEKQESP